MGRNIAEAAHRASSGLGLQGEKATDSSVLLVSAVGDDLFAKLLRDEMVGLNMRTDGLVTADGEKTAVCNMLLNAEGDLMNGVAAMDVVEQLSSEKVSFTDWLRYLLTNIVRFLLTSTRTPLHWSVWTEIFPQKTSKK